GAGHRLQHGGRGGRSSPRDAAQRQLPVLDAGHFADRLPLGGDEVAGGDAFPFHGVDGFGGVEVPGAHDDRAAAEHQVAEDAVEPTDVEQRQAGEPDLLGVVDALGDRAVERVHDQVV